MSAFLVRCVGRDGTTQIAVVLAKTSEAAIAAVRTIRPQDELEVLEATLSVETVCDLGLADSRPRML